MWCGANVICVKDHHAVLDDLEKEKKLKIYNLNVKWFTILLLIKNIFASCFFTPFQNINISQQSIKHVNGQLPLKAAEQTFKPHRYCASCFRQLRRSFSPAAPWVPCSLSSTALAILKLEDALSICLDGNVSFSKNSLFLTWFAMPLHAKLTTFPHYNKISPLLLMSL